jgi:hypothetical protein
MSILDSLGVAVAKFGFSEIKYGAVFFCNITVTRIIINISVV